jgi:hypothetical protein
MNFQNMLRPTYSKDGYVTIGGMTFRCTIIEFSAKHDYTPEDGWFPDIHLREIDHDFRRVQRRPGT